MKYILTFFLILTIELSTYAQNQNSEMSIRKTEKPILIINDTIIGSVDLLNKIPSNKVLELNIFKERKLSTNNLFIENKKNAGIIMAKINHEFKLKTQKDLNIFFGMNEKNDIYVNGYLIENKNHNITTESIVGIELIKADNFRLKTFVLNIEIE